MNTHTCIDFNKLGMTNDKGTDLVRLLYTMLSEIIAHISIFLLIAT